MFSRVVPFILGASTISLANAERSLDDKVALTAFKQGTILKFTGDPGKPTDVIKEDPYGVNVSYTNPTSNFRCYLGYLRWDEKTPSIPVTAQLRFKDMLFGSCSSSDSLCEPVVIFEFEAGDAAKIQGRPNLGHCIGTGRAITQNVGDLKAAFNRKIQLLAP